MLGVVSIYRYWHLKLTRAVCSPFTETVMMLWAKSAFFLSQSVVQLNSVCILRFYQIRASLKVPPRVPHKVETSLLHPGGKGTCAVI